MARERSSLDGSSFGRLCCASRDGEIHAACDGGDGDGVCSFVFFFSLSLSVFLFLAYRQFYEISEERSAGDQGQRICTARYVGNRGALFFLFFFFFLPQDRRARFRFFFHPSTRVALARRAAWAVSDRC